MTTGPGTPDLAMLITAANAYFAAHNTALSSRNTIDYRRTFGSACSICSYDAEQIDSYRSKAQIFKGGFYVARNPSLVKAVPHGGTLLLTVHQDAGRLVDKSGATVQAFTVTDTRNVYLEFRENRDQWTVVGAAVVKP